MFNTNQFTNFCKKAKKVVSGKHTLPILDCFLIQGGRIRVSNLEIDVLEKIEGLENLPAFCMDFRDFDGLVTKLKNQDFEFIVDVHPEATPVPDRLNWVVNIEIKTSKGKFTFQGLPAEDFPVIRSTPENAPFAKILKSDVSLIRKAVKYSANDEFRPVMNSVCLSDKVCATDRMSMCFYEREETTPKFLIPSKLVPLIDDLFYSCFQWFETVNEIEWLDGKKIEKTRDALKHISLVNENTEIIYYVIEGEYPDYLQVIPNEFSSFLQVPAKELSELVDMCEMTLKNSHKNYIRLLNDPLLEEMTVSCDNKDFGKTYSNTIPVKNSGDEIEIGFDINMLKNVLTTEKASQYDFKFVDPSHCCIINEEVLLMPVML